jgi:hypothetical protein
VVWQVLMEDHAPPASCPLCGSELASRGFSAHVRRGCAHSALWKTWKDREIARVEEARMAKKSAASQPCSGCGLMLTQAGMLRHRCSFSKSAHGPEARQPTTKSQPVMSPQSLEEKVSLVIPEARPRFKTPGQGDDKWAAADKRFAEWAGQEMPVLETLSVSELSDGLCDGLYLCCSEVFGQVKPPRGQGGTEQEPRPVQRARQAMKEVRRKVRASERDGGSTAETKALWSAARHELARVLRMAKADRTARDTAEALKRFRQDPFRYVRSKVKPEEEGTPPAFSQEVAESHFRKLYTRTEQYEFHAPPFFPKPPSLSGPTMHGTTPGRDEILSSLRRKKNSAAPGWSGVTYVALKRLASCHDILVLLIQRAWREGIPPSWRRAIVLQFAKAGADGSDPADYRPIALTEHVAKLFFSVVQRRVSLHMSANGLWQTQKGFVEKVAGCIEHSTVTAEAMKDAKRSGRDICVTWLDLQNAFG